MVQQNNRFFSLSTYVYLKYFKRTITFNIRRKNKITSIILFLTRGLFTKPNANKPLHQQGYTILDQRDKRLLHGLRLLTEHSIIRLPLQNRAIIKAT